MCVCTCDTRMCGNHACIPPAHVHAPRRNRCAVLVASVDLVVGGRSPLSITRAEGYVVPDGGNGTGHDGPANNPLSRFNQMLAGQLYFQARRS